MLIQGEIGTGKKLISRTLHSLNSRRTHNFVTLNCAAIPLSLMESGAGVVLMLPKITEYGLRVCSNVLLCTLFLVSSASAHVSLQVEWRAGGLSVRAEKVPLTQILQEIARRTGMEIRGLGGLQELVSVRFAGLPLQEGLQKLSVNYAIVWKTFSQEDQRPVLALVFGPRALPPLQALPDEVIPSIEGTEPEGEPMVEELRSPEEQLEILHALAGQGNEEALRKALFNDLDPPIQAAVLALLAEQNRQGAVTLLIDATKSDQPQKRLQALQLLYHTGQADERTVLSALSQALTDENIAVKGYALQALAAWGGIDALEYLRQAVHDPDPTIRLLVLQQVARQNQGLPLLQEALADDDEAVRSLAASLVAGHKGR
jgi:hypothetical protein